MNAKREGGGLAKVDARIPTRHAGGTSQRRFSREVQTLGVQLEVERMECGALEGPRSGAVRWHPKPLVESFGVSGSGLTDGIHR